MKPWVSIGASSAFLSVALGAFGAHALSKSLTEKNLAVYHTAAQYQMVHALALVLLGVYGAQNPDISTTLPGWSFTLGTVLFSGSLYALALTDIRILGAITPFGGLLFMVGWLTFAYAAWK